MHEDRFSHEAAQFYSLFSFQILSNIKRETIFKQRRLEIICHHYSISYCDRSLSQNVKVQFKQLNCENDTVETSWIHNSDSFDVYWTVRCVHMEG